MRGSNSSTLDGMYEDVAYHRPTGAVLITAKNPLHNRHSPFLAHPVKLVNEDLQVHQ
jgi:hypothetical protein